MADTLAELYKRLLAQQGGDTGEAFTRTELGRQDKAPELAGLDPETLVALNRYAQSYDTPATSLAAVPYEALKGIEQTTGIPALAAPGNLLNKMGVPVSLPNSTTSPASMQNVGASLQGGGAG